VQVKSRNKNTEGLDVLYQVERGRGNQTSLADGDLGPRSRSTQGSTRQGGGDVAISFARGKPNQGATGVARGTTPLSSKPNQEAVQSSIAYVLSKAVNTHSNYSTNKRIKKEAQEEEENF
jgi:hypothetical protein